MPKTDNAKKRARRKQSQATPLIIPYQNADRHRPPFMEISPNPYVQRVYSMNRCTCGCEETMKEHMRIAKRIDRNIGEVVGSAMNYQRTYDGDMDMHVRMERMVTSLVEE